MFNGSTVPDLADGTKFRATDELESGYYVKQWDAVEYVQEGLHGRVYKHEFSEFKDYETFYLIKEDNE